MNTALHSTSTADQPPPWCTGDNTATPEASKANGAVRQRGGVRILKPVLPVAVALGLLIGSTYSASAATAHRPFSGHVAGYAYFAPVDTATCPHVGLLIGGLQIRSVATGQATHLGRVSMAAAHCAAVDSSIANGHLTFTAANGDEVDVTYSGTCPFDPTTAVVGQTVIACDVTLTVAGGTGRFTNAAGEAAMTADITFEGSTTVNWPGSWTWNGWIEY